MNIVFAGSIGRLPVGGHAWVDMQYLAGLRALGHNVCYLEECGAESWVYNWDTEELTTDLAYPAGYVAHCMSLLGMEAAWIYRAGEHARGMVPADLAERCAAADLLLIRAVPLATWRPEYRLPRRRIFIDADPGFTQISLLQGHAELTATVDHCERLFTIAQRLGAPDCPIPTAGRTWATTRPPVALSHWPVATDGAATHFTAVMQWRGFRDVTYAGVRYGQKDQEFPRFVDVPCQTAQPFRLALTGGAPDELARHGWEVIPGWVPSRTPETYRAFIAESRAEFGVAKHGYVAMRGGWFSDRSVCYLASGRPVLLEDTGLADWLPIGDGVVTFTDVPSALAGVTRINAGYQQHRRAARQIAETHFDAQQVLPALLDAAMA
ncbi:MAG TPA: glycosyltransferase family 1 protein [Chloroflexia bacterium]|nr:glycosyltransferase family 1 protein [Chloroflexia bacterium]